MAKRRRKSVKKVASPPPEEMVAGPHGLVPAPAPGTPKSVILTVAGEDQLPAGPHGHMVHVEFDKSEDAAELLEHLSKLREKVKKVRKAVKAKRAVRRKKR
jgi:hypothetical protein